MQWTPERIAEHFRREIQARFEAENEGYRKACTAAQREPRDSPLWHLYQNAQIEINVNYVRIILPIGSMLWPDGMAMFADTEVAMTQTCVTVVDGRLVLELALVPMWDDARSAAVLRPTSHPGIGVDSIGKFWFWDETQVAYGPHDTQQQALEGLLAYIEDLG